MFKKPTSKSIAHAGIQAGAFVAGAKVGDGVVAIMPESVASYKRIIVGVVGIAAAACIVPKTTMAEAGQAALIGMGAKQFYDELTEVLADAVPVKVSSSTANKFVNALVGHTDVPLQQIGAGAPWMGDSVDMWERPANNQSALSFTGV